MAITFEKVLILKNVPIFANVSEQALADLIAGSEEKSYKAGEVILDADTDTDALYVILSGLVRCGDGDKVVRELGPRQFFGETTVFNKASFPYKITAHDKTVLLKISNKTLYHMMALYPSLAFGFIGYLSKQVHQEQIA